MAALINRIVMDGTLEGLTRLDISILEKGRNADPMELRVRRRDAVRERFPCHNPLCNDGGLALGALLRELVRSRQTEYIGTDYCVGQEGDPEIPETLKSCQTRYEVSATLKFNEPR